MKLLALRFRTLHGQDVLYGLVIGMGIGYDTVFLAFLMWEDEIRLVMLPLNPFRGVHNFSVVWMRGVGYGDGAEREGLFFGCWRVWKE